MSKRTDRLLSGILVLVLAAACAFNTVSCGKTETADTTADTETVNTASADAKEVTITVQVTDDKGETTDFVITTTETTLRGALEQEKLVEGEDSDFGLYIKTVNGLTADYDTDKAYWALLKDGEFMSNSADSEKLEDGAEYQLVYVKS